MRRPKDDLNNLWWSISPPNILFNSSPVVFFVVSVFSQPTLQELIYSNFDRGQLLRERLWFHKCHQTKSSKQQTADRADTAHSTKQTVHSINSYRGASLANDEKESNPSRQRSMTKSCRKDMTWYMTHFNSCIPAISYSFVLLNQNLCRLPIISYMAFRQHLVFKCVFLFVFACKKEHSVCTLQRCCCVCCVYAAQIWSWSLIAFIPLDRYMKQEQKRECL